MNDALYVNGTNSGRRRRLLEGAIIVAIIGAVVAFVTMRPDKDDREASGWMYTEVAMVPRACPPLAGEVKAISKRPIMTVGDAKRIAGLLHATAAASEQATGRYEGRRAMGMPVGRPPVACMALDPNYDSAYDIGILEDFKFRIADRKGDGA